jgi:hypothetical protein
MTVNYDEMFDALCRGTLDPEGFSHRHHVGTGFAALRRHEFFEATHLYATGLRSVVAKAGVPEKYNATVTLAFMSLIAERMDGKDNAEAFLQANPDLLTATPCAAVFLRDYPAVTLPAGSP